MLTAQQSNLTSEDIGLILASVTVACVARRENVILSEVEKQAIAMRVSRVPFSEDDDASAIHEQFEMVREEIHMHRMLQDIATEADKYLRKAPSEQTR